MNVVLILAVYVAAILADDGGYPSEYGHGNHAFHGHYGGT